MSHLQFHNIDYLYLDMQDLILKTSIWLLAESIR